MGDRLKIFGVVALLGFMAGIIAQVTAVYFIPWLIAVLPSLAGLTSFLFAGFAGACITVAMVSAWAYLTGHRDRL
jgi:hypothetical protein